MKFQIQDRIYDFDGEYTVAEAMLYFDKAKVGMSELYTELRRGNPYVAATFMFILKRRAGEAVRWEDMQALPANSVQPIVDDADGPAEEDTSAGEPPDPTEASGTTPGPDTTTTS